MSVILSEAKNPGISFALIELSNAGILRFAQNDRRWPFLLRMTNNPYKTVDIIGSGRARAQIKLFYQQENLMVGLVTAEGTHLLV